MYSLCSVKAAVPYVGCAVGAGVWNPEDDGALLGMLVGVVGALLGANVAAAWREAKARATRHFIITPPDPSLLPSSAASQVSPAAAKPRLSLRRKMRVE